MRSGLGNLVLKEVKELLRDPKILVGIVIMPLLMFPLLSYTMSISQTSMQEAAESSTIAILDQDGGLAAQNLKTTLSAISNITLQFEDAANLSVLLDDLQTSNAATLLVIPPGFSDNLTNTLRARIEVYALFKGVSISELGKAELATALLNAYEQIHVVQTIQYALNLSAPQAYALLDPIDLSASTVIRGKLVRFPPSAIFGVILSQSMMFPTIIMMMIIYAMQIASTSIAIEKEEKTLETLLTLPVGRLTILVGKLTGSIVVAVVSALAYMVGFNMYITSAIGGIGAGGLQAIDLQALGLAPTPEAYVLLGLTMFVTITSALALAISIAVFADNVRSAQSMTGLLTLPIVIPSLVLMFADIDILPLALQAILYVIPYTHTMLSAKALFLSDYAIMARSIAYISLFTVIVLAIAARIFTSDKIITARLSLDRFKIRRKDKTPG